jgi:hypothetical protein
VTDELAGPAESGETDVAGRAGGSGEADGLAGSGEAVGAASDRMSIRQPVSRAASLAFCPSLPIASESW